MKKNVSNNKSSTHSSYLTRVLDESDINFREQSNLPTSAKKINMTSNTLLEVRRYLDLEKRSQALVDSGTIEQREHNELFQVGGDELNLSQIEFHIEKSEKRAEHLKAGNFQPVPELPPAIKAAAQRASEAYTNAWKKKD